MRHRTGEEPPRCGSPRPRSNEGTAPCLRREGELRSFHRNPWTVEQTDTLPVRTQLTRHERQLSRTSGLPYDRLPPLVSICGIQTDSTGRFPSPVVPSGTNYSSVRVIPARSGHGLLPLSRRSSGEITSVLVHLPAGRSSLSQALGSGGDGRCPVPGWSLEGRELFAVMRVEKSLLSSNTIDRVFAPSCRHRRRIMLHP